MNGLTAATPLPNWYTDTRDLYQDYKDGLRPVCRFAPHSLERGVAMGEQNRLTADEIREALFKPTIIGFSPKHQTVLLTAGRCTLSVGLTFDGAPRVATILWATAADWAASYASGVIPGREQRDLTGMSA